MNKSFDILTDSQKQHLITVQCCIIYMYISFCILQTNCDEVMSKRIRMFKIAAG